MKKRIFFFLIPFILGCNYLFPQNETPAVIATQREEIQPAIETARPTQAEEISAPPIESTPRDASAFSITRIHKSGGDLYSQLAIESQKAESLAQTPFLEFDATWCPPCNAINTSLEAKDAMTMQAFAGAYIIRVDVDEWGWGDGNKFRVDGIPIYFKLDGQGNPTGKVIDGNAWGENIPENFAPVLDEFFHAP